MKNSLLLQQNEQASLKTQLRVLGMLTFVLSLFMTITILSYTPTDIENGSVPIQALFGFIDDIDDFRAKVEISQNKLGLPGSYIATFCVHKTIGYWSLVLSFLLAACTWEVFVNGFLGYNFFRRSFWILLLAVSFSTVSFLLKSSLFPTIPTEFSGTLSNFIGNSLLIGIGKIGAFAIVTFMIVLSTANIFTYGLSGLYLATRKKQTPAIPDDVLRAQARYYVDIYSDDEEPIEVLRSTIDVDDEIDNQTEIKEAIEDSMNIPELPSALVPVDEVEEIEFFEDDSSQTQPIEVLESLEEFSLQPEEIEQTELVPFQEFEEITPTVIGTVPLENYDTQESIEDNINSLDFDENIDEYTTEEIEETETVDANETLSGLKSEITPQMQQDVLEIEEADGEEIVSVIEEEQHLEELTSESTESEEEVVVDESIIDAPITFESIDLLSEEPSNQSIFMPQLGDTILPDFEDIGDIELDDEMVDSVMGTEDLVITNEEVVEDILDENPSIEMNEPSLSIDSESDNTPIISSESKQHILPFEFAPSKPIEVSKESSTKTRYLVDFSQPTQHSNVELLRSKLESVHIPFSSIDQNETLLSTIYTLHFTKSFDSLQSQTLYHDVIEVLKAPGVVIESFLDTKKVIEIEIPKKNLQEILHDIKVIQPNIKGILPIDFGYKNNGDVNRLDLTDCYNILIGGANGTGKTNLLVSIIHSMSKNNDAVALKFLPIILNTHPYQSVEPIFKHSFAVVQGNEQTTIHTSEIQALQAIKALFLETKKRLELFDTERKTTISAYNYLKNPLEQIPYIVTIIDPIEMISAHKESREYLSVILLCGSAVGIHILAQSKNVPSIDPLLLQRFPCTIASFTNSKTSSRMLIQSTSAEGLLASNDFIFNFTSYSQKQYFRFFMSNEMISSSAIQNLRPDTNPYPLPVIEQKEQIANKNIDPMLLKIAEFVVKEQKALIGSILHKFNLSYEDTVAYISQLEKAGILSQYNQNNRTVLVKDISDLPRYL